jgi:hypothetical protein
MKKLLTICLLIATAFTSQAQDGKPTKEQTIQFIKSYFEQKIFSYDCFQDGNEFSYSKERYYKNYNLVFNGNILEVSWDENNKLRTTQKTTMKRFNDDNISKYKLLIDLNKTESIVLGYGYSNYLECEKSYYNISAIFKAIPEHKFIKEYDGKLTEESLVKIPINVYKCDSGCDHESINKKILQAFNHLRKLCGAPEPISFD